MLVRRTYLEQCSPADILPARVPDEPVETVRAEDPAPEFARFLYLAAGIDRYWTDLLGWTRAQWLDWLAQPGLETWVCWLRGCPVGYAQLHGVPDAAGTDVELAYFGLLAGYRDRGLGGSLLRTALRRGWSLANRHSGFGRVRRVWVRTCTLEGPRVLANYKARGLQPYRVEEIEQVVPERSPGPWPDG